MSLYLKHICLCDYHFNNMNILNSHCDMNMVCQEDEPA